MISRKHRRGPGARSEAQREAELSQVFLALGDPTRRALVRLLAESDRSVGELAAPFAMSLAAVSKHIKVLEAAGIVARSVDGRVHTLALRVEALAGALDWIVVYRNFWQRRIDALNRMMGDEGAGDPHA